MLSEARAQEQLGKAITAPQREKMEELIAAGKDVYAERVKGASVVAAFRRYCDTRDPLKITDALYSFSMAGAGGLDSIAHYNIAGFRQEYPHPIIYITQLLYPRWERSHYEFQQDPEAYHSLYVYTDGMTSGHVRFAIKEYADAMSEVLAEDFLHRVRQKEESQLQALASRLGYRVVPLDAE